MMHWSCSWRRSDCQTDGRLVVERFFGESCTSLVDCFKADATMHYEKRVASLDLQRGVWRARPFEGASGLMKWTLWIDTFVGFPTWLFSKIVVPQNGWVYNFIMENPLNPWMIWGYIPTIFGNIYMDLTEPLISPGVFDAVLIAVPGCGVGSGAGCFPWSMMVNDASHDAKVS